MSILSNSTITSDAGSRHRRKQERPGEILDAALRLFIEKGYANTRAEDVAALAGVSKGTVYVYYENKDALFRAVVSENIVPILKEFQEIVGASNLPSEALFELYFQAWWERFGATQLSGIIKLIVSEASSFPEIAQFFAQEVIQPNMQLLSSIVQRGVDRGEFRAVPVLSTVHSIMSPLVLKAIWCNSVEKYDCDTMRIDPLELIRDHVQFCLASLRINRQ
jgi:TetR/AcrR family transcriptional regulator